MSACNGNGGPAKNRRQPHRSSSAAHSVAQWTEADQAEQDVLVDAIVRGYLDHRDHCRACSRGEACPALGVAVEALTDWRRSRALRSRAVALRAEQHAREWLNEAAA